MACILASRSEDADADAVNYWRCWSTHNLIGHPLSEIAHLLGLDEWARILHDSTIPPHEPGTGRG